MGAEPVDVIIPTKNSMKPCFPQCIQSIRANVPVNRIIIVDKGSTDGTVEFAKASGCTVIDDSDGTRATARDKGIRESDTEFFVLVDSDVLLEPGWFSKIRGAMEEGKVGAACGFLYPTGRHMLNLYRSLAAMYRTGGLQNLARYGVFAGSNVLVRKKAVEGLHTPRDLDDTYIGEYIRSSGYIVRCLPSPLAFHVRGRETQPWECFSAGFMMRKYRLHNRRLTYFVKRVFFNSPVEALWITLYGKDPRAAFERFRVNVYTMGGYLYRAVNE